MRAVCLLFVIFTAAVAEKGSPVMKVIELLDEMKAKITSDLEAESAAMEEYLSFCNDETKEKANAMKTADGTIENLNAIIEESKATITAKDDEVATLGTTISDKTNELEKVTKVREAENADFVAAEKELVTSVDECARAATALEKGLSLLQMRGGNKAARKQMKRQLLAVKNAMSTILAAAWVDVSSAKKLKSLLQQSSSSESNDDLSLSLHQPQAKQVAYESKSGVIVDMIKEMQKKAETELSELRKKEMTATHEFKMLEQGLTNEITHSKEALSAATSAKAQAGEDQAKAEGDLVEVTKTKSADQSYSNELRGECEAKATEWEARQKSAKGEMGALAKAKEILASGVKALVQVKSQTHRQSFDDAEENQDLRQKIAKKIDAIGRKYHSYVFMSLAAAARSDPFVKIRGLIEEMIAALLKQAEEEATQKAFCDEEMGKSKKSKADKEAKIDKYQVRMDKASSAKTELDSAVKELEKEIKEIDTAQAEATKIRTEENTDNTKAMKDFKDSADAVISAIGVLKSFYEGGAFIQTSSHSKAMSKAKQPEFGGANADAGGSIISVLEVAEEDFTRLYAEVEASEEAAADAYEKLTTDNKVSKATKSAEVKGKLSEIKGLEVQLQQATEDHGSTSAELDAVLAYLDKLKPQCETKVMSYEEKVAKRNAEIEGLKEALSILEGTGVAAFLERRY